jgi:peptidoglycan/xylan/chitin deacetylase (PgdA/CDA1 family)
MQNPFSRQIQFIPKRKPTGIRALTYHSVSIGKSPLAVPIENFKLQMRWVKENCSIIRTSQLIGFLENKSSLPPNPVLITLDDGFQDNYLNAWPVLAESEIAATIFIATGFIGGYMPLHSDMLPMMSWVELSKMQASGLLEFGAHTHTHNRLAEIPENLAMRTILDSKLEIQNKLGVVTDAFCYPQNCFNINIMKMVRQAGFKVAFGGSGFIHRDSPRYALRRIQIEGDVSLAVFQKRLAHDGHWFRRKIKDQIYKIQLGE